MHDNKSTRVVFLVDGVEKTRPQGVALIEGTPWSTSCKSEPLSPSSWRTVGEPAHRLT